jgi:hypothetical protein
LSLTAIAGGADTRPLALNEGWRTGFLLPGVRREGVIRQQKSRSETGSAYQ